jgi:hypothetical protein
MIPSFSRRHRRLAYFHSTVRNMDTNNKIYLKACWNDDDLQEGDIVQSQLTLEDIQQQAVDMFGLYSDDDSNNANHQLSTLEYYNGHDWRPLTQQAIGSEIRNNTLATSSSLPLPIRIPSLFDEEYGLNNEFIKLRKATPEDMKQEGNMPSPEQMQLKDVIEFLHRRLLEEGYTRHVNVDSSFNGKKQSDESVDTLGAKSTNSSDSTFANWRHTVEVDSVHMPTRDWILEQASSDMEVRSILLSQPGALQHVTQALHYPFL